MVNPYLQGKASYGSPTKHQENTRPATLGSSLALKKFENIKRSVTSSQERKSIDKKQLKKNKNAKKASSKVQAKFTSDEDEEDDDDISSAHQASDSDESSDSFLKRAKGANKFIKKAEKDASSSKQETEEVGTENTEEEEEEEEEETTEDIDDASGLIDLRKKKKDNRMKLIDDNDDEIDSEIQAIGTARSNSRMVSISSTSMRKGANKVTFEMYSDNESDKTMTEDDDVSLVQNSRLVLDVRQLDFEPRPGSNNSMRRKSSMKKPASPIKEAFDYESNFDDDSRQSEASPNRFVNDVNDLQPAKYKPKPKQRTSRPSSRSNDSIATDLNNTADESSASEIITIKNGSSDFYQEDFDTETETSIRSRSSIKRYSKKSGRKKESEMKSAQVQVDDLELMRHSDLVKNLSLYSPFSLGTQVPLSDLNNLIEFNVVNNSFNDIIKMNLAFMKNFLSTQRQMYESEIRNIKPRKFYQS